MSTVLYTVASREMLFNGTHNVEDMHNDSDYWYEGNDREKSLELAMDEGVTFWQDWQTDDPETRLFYKIFQNN